MTTGGLPGGVVRTLSSGVQFLQYRATQRKIWLKVHLYLGLSVGALLVLIGLTGSILVFHHEIDEWLNPDLLQVHPPAGGPSTYLPVDEIVAAAVKAMPAEAKMIYGVFPRNDAVAYEWHFLIPAVPHPKTRIDFSLYHVFVNPYTAEVTGSRLFRPAGLSGAFPRTFIGFIFALHYALLLPRGGDPAFGDTVVSIIGMMLMVSLLTGLYLWWPHGQGWRHALTIKRHAHIRRLIFDQHRLIGFYSGVVLLALFVSGVYLNFSGPFNALIEVFSPITDRYAVQSHVLPNRQSISVGDAMRLAEERYPQGRMDWLYLPRTPTGTYTICNRDIEGISLFLTRRCAVLDQYSGETLYVQTPESGTGGDYFIQWQWPIHSGQVFGMPGRLLVLTAGLVCPVLFGTGGYLWWRKRVKRIGGNLSKPHRP